MRRKTMPWIIENSIEFTPEYRAAMGLIDAAEYLATFGDHGGPVLPVDHSGRGVQRPNYKRTKRPK